MDEEKAMIADVEAGFTDFELMERYNLSAANLREKLLQLMRDNVVSSSHVYWRPILYDYEVGDSERRVAPRYPLKLLLPVSAIGFSESTSGLLVDINEKGGCVKGACPSFGEIVALKIDPGKVCPGPEITLDVVFRWSERTGSDEFLSGFEIMSVSGQDRERFRELIRTVVHG